MSATQIRLPSSHPTGDKLNIQPGTFNLKANPRAVGAIRGQIETYIAHEASGEEYDRFWQYAANTYPGYPLYKHRVGARRIPIMIMTPVKQ